MSCLSEDIYERLAAALDALPHGFARTTSGVELRLINVLKGVPR
jgi:hypothetical protein